MSTDWKALCAELAEELERCRPLAEVPDCLARARAALAAEPVADGPAVPEGREPASVAWEPSDEELLELMPQQFREDLATVSRMAAHGAGTGVTPGLFRVSLNTGALDYARAVLARYGHQPAPPVEGEVAEFIAQLKSYAEYGTPIRLIPFLMGRAADLLEQRHPAPVPVSERPPGPEDCDAEHYCWRWNMIGGLWARQPLARSWYEFESHWLPSTALPLPQGEVEA